MKRKIVNYRMVRFINNNWQQIKTVKKWNDVNRLNREHFITEETYDIIYNNMINI